MGAPTETVLVVLRRAQKRLRRHGRARGYFAQDAEGRYVKAGDPTAVRWDMVGAIHAETTDEDVAYAAITALSNITRRCVSAFDADLSAGPLGDDTASEVFRLAMKDVVARTMGVEAA